MNIKEGNFKFIAKLTDRKKTTHCVLHHAMWKNCTAQDIHRIHINERKWYGIGYHYFVGKDGTVTTGRGIEKVGAHTEGCNDYSVGICFEGDYEQEREMTSEQLIAGKELCKMISDIYPDIVFEVHGKMPNQNTLCAGKYFPFKQLTDTTTPFTDINEHWSENTIKQAFEMGLLKGYEDNTFRPNNSLTRAEGVALIMNLYKKLTK